MRKGDLVALLLTLGLGAGAATAAGNGIGGAGMGCATTLPAPDAVELSEGERANLLRMREEEKMARDLYLHFYDQWGLMPFSNIAAAEQQHMDRMLEHLEAQGLEDPASSESGRFVDAGIQALYDELAGRGAASAEGALTAAAYVEEIDIFDLQQALVLTEDPDQRLTYVNLMTGSYKHLQAFVRQLTQRGVGYAAQVLPEEQVEWILAGDFAPNGFTATPATSTSCFIPVPVAGDGRAGNGLVLGRDDSVDLVMELIADPRVVGRTARLFVVAIGGAGWALRLDEAGNWGLWDGTVDDLEPIRREAPLAGRERYRVYAGPVGGLNGGYSIYVGYVFDDGTLVYQATPLNFTAQ